MFGMEGQPYLNLNQSKWVCCIGQVIVPWLFMNQRDATVKETFVSKATFSRPTHSQAVLSVLKDIQRRERHTVEPFSVTTCRDNC